MPRIDPLLLLKCLSVLLSPEGGILSRDEVPRLVNLMTKFSKKLVSKCVYVLILKSTETSLVDMFMAEGGWTLIQTWLQDAAQTGNWVFVKEILGLLLITPVDVERLKMNCLPKLIKNLSRREDLDGVAQLSNQIVQNWLVIVKGTSHNQNITHVQVQSEISQPGQSTSDVNPEKVTAINSNSIETYTHNSVEASDANSGSIKPNTFYKVSVRDGKQVFKKLEPSQELGSVEDYVKPLSNDESDNAHLIKNDKKEDIKVKEENEKGDKTEEKDKQSKSKSSSSSSSSKKDRDRSKSSHSSSSRHKSGSSSSSRDKSKDKRDKEKGDKDKSSSSRSRSDKHREKERDKHKRDEGGKSSSSHKSKDKNDSKDKDGTKEKVSKEKQAEKDKDTLAKLKPQTLDKLGRIPKKSASDDKQKEDKPEVKKKPSFSILDRKSSGDERVKTVKVFNSKMRSTGLEEEVKPPPPRNSTKKPNPTIQLPTIPQKRHSPPREPSTVPPEKKIKIDKVDIPERPGSIKLIPPKPKPAVLQESDMFMDALTASATKKEPKKRKRRPSVTKDVPSSPTSSVNNDTATTTPTSPTSSTLGLKNIAPINFYQDTLSEESATENKEDDKENSEVSQDPSDTPASPTTPTDPYEGEVNPPKVQKMQDGLKGVLLYSKKKGPKRSIQWKAEDQLVEIRYFELDETERVNVTKTFMDMAKMEMTSEREALQLSRKLINEDIMEPQTSWKMLYICDQPEALASPGSKSLEKDIQFAREKSVLQALYFDKRRIPDSPEEPIPENHQMSDPIIIPLDDPESQEIDLRSTPWPDPKGSPPVVEPPQLAPVFHQNIPFNPNFNNMNNGPPPQFAGIPPRFVAPSGPHGPPGSGNFVPPNMIHNNMMGPPNIHPQDVMLNQGGINPNAFAPGPIPDGYMGPGNENPNFPVPQFNGPPGPMFGPNNFNFRGGRGGFRRGGGNNNGGWIRMSGSGPGHGNWKRGGGHRGGRLCKNVQNHGYCRNRDNCQFVHPT